MCKCQNKCQNICTNNQYIYLSKNFSVFKYFGLYIYTYIHIYVRDSLKMINYIKVGRMFFKLGFRAKTKKSN